MVIFGVKNAKCERRVKAPKTDRYIGESKGQETNRDIISKSGRATTSIKLSDAKSQEKYMSPRDLQKHVMYRIEGSRE